MSDDKVLSKINELTRKVTELSKMKEKLRKLDDAMLILRRLDDTIKSMKPKVERLDKNLEKITDRLAL